MYKMDYNIINMSFSKRQYDNACFFMVIYNFIREIIIVSFI